MAGKNLVLLMAAGTGNSLPYLLSADGSGKDCVFRRVFLVVSEGKTGAEIDFDDVIRRPPMYAGSF